MSEENDQTIVVINNGPLRVLVVDADDRVTLPATPSGLRDEPLFRYAAAGIPRTNLFAMERTAGSVFGQKYKPAIFRLRYRNPELFIMILG